MISVVNRKPFWLSYCSFVAVSLPTGAGLAVLDGQLYAVGGYDGRQHLSSVECYSACVNRWRPISDMNSSRCYVGTVVLANKIFAVGGYDGVTLLKSIECYDSGTREWTAAAAMETSRCEMGVAVVVEHWAVSTDGGGGGKGKNKQSSTRAKQGTLGSTRITTWH